MKNKTVNEIIALLKYFKRFTIEESKAAYHYIFTHPYPKEDQVLKK